MRVLVVEDELLDRMLPGGLEGLERREEWLLSHEDGWDNNWG